MARLARITLYPVKSLPGVDVAQASFTAGGSLRHDRAFALCDDGGNLINGKRTAAVHRLQVRCAIRGDDVAITVGSGTDETTHVLIEGIGDRSAVGALEARLSLLLQQCVRLLYDGKHGFPDDLDSPGPTVVSTASLQSVADWYPSMNPDEVRRRFRANVELDDCEPFWEDHLYGDPGTVVRFRIGTVELEGINPCLRCVVPSRDTSTGDQLEGFQREFVDRRKATLPRWANRARFDVHYRFSVNTWVSPGQAGKIISVGDEVTVVGAGTRITA